MTALCCAVVGFLMMVVFASNSHRWTLYSTNMTAKTNYQRWFGNDNEPLDYTYTTHDEARLTCITKPHPYYLFEVQSEVKKWVLNMKVRDKLFKEGIAPRGVSALKGQSFATVFAIIKRKYSYHGDTDGDAMIGEHLDALLIEVEKRKKKMQSSSLSSSSQRQVFHELPAISDKDAEIAALKRELEEKNAALEEKDNVVNEKDLALEENKAAIEEKDKVIAALEERLRRMTKGCNN